MKIFKFKPLFIAAITGVALLFSSCDNSEAPTFTINGKITNAKDQTLYLSNIGLKKITVLDSVKLKEDGSFEFKQPRPECYDFYFIAMQGKKPITVAIDSTETVTITCDAEKFAEEYTVEGNDESKAIQELDALQAALQKQVNSMLEAKSSAIIKTRNDIYALIGNFKENIIKQYIAPDPGKASAYYALTMNLNGEPLFQYLNNRIDSKCFAAVATNLKVRYPEAKRTKFLSKIAQEGLNSTRPKKTRTVEVGESDITTTGLFDIKLPGVNGDSIKLSSLAGNVVLLDFTIYEDAQISSRNIKLREIYNKYKDKGFEVYQVSFDTREHFWQQSASNLPWTCVRDGQGAISSNITLYNIQTLPTFYLINRQNEIVLRDYQITDLDKEIKKLLKE